MRTRTTRELAGALREAMKAADYGTAEHLASAAGIKAGTLRLWLRGKTQPRLLTFAGVAAVLRKRIDDFAYAETDAACPNPQTLPRKQEGS